MTDNHPPGSTPPESGQPVPGEEEPLGAEPAEDPGYLSETGEAVGEDGSVVPIIGGLPAVDGSAWDIGAAADERGVGLAEHEASQEHRAAEDDTR